MQITPNQAAQIIINYGEHIENAELVEICEKIIGTGLEKVIEQPKGYRNLLLALKGFALNIHTR